MPDTKKPPLGIMIKLGAKPPANGDATEPEEETDQQTAAESVADALGLTGEKRSAVVDALIAFANS